MTDNAQAAVFPGQGSQRPGMARDFFDEYDLARRVFAEAEEASGADLSEICFAEEDERLNLTEFTQPCILTAEIAAFRVLQEEFGYNPAFFGGHSLGEYSALVAAGAIPFADAVKIVRKRGALMQGAVPPGVGAMAAVILEGIGDTDFQAITEASGAEIANWNSASQVVISGKREAVEAAAAALREKLSGGKGPEEGGADIRFLEVSAPFHSSLMKDIEAEFQEFLAGFSASFQPEKAQGVLSNFTGDFHKAQEMTENLVRQISGSVKWVENMKTLMARAGDILEIGPNRPLGKFFASVGGEAKSVINVRSIKRVFKK